MRGLPSAAYWADHVQTEFCGRAAVMLELDVVIMVIMIIIDTSSIKILIIVLLLLSSLSCL